MKSGGTCSRGGSTWLAARKSAGWGECGRAGRSGCAREEGRMGEGALGRRWARQGQRGTPADPDSCRRGATTALSPRLQA